MTTTRQHPLNTLTLEALRRAGACQDARDAFAATWGESATLGRDFACRVIDDEGCTDWAEWLVTSPLCPVPIRAEYDKASAPIWAEYNKASAQIRAEYEKAHAPIWAEYEKASAPIWAEYNKARAPIWAEYNKASAQIRAEYEKARATILRAAILHMGTYTP